MKKGGHNIATKSHDTVLWVIFAVLFMKRQDIYNGMILANQEILINTSPAASIQWKNQHILNPFSNALINSSINESWKIRKRKRHKAELL